MTDGVTDEKIKEAQRRYLKEWRAKNPDRVKEYNRKWWEKRAAREMAAQEVK